MQPFVEGTSALRTYSVKHITAHNPPRYSVNRFDWLNVGGSVGFIPMCHEFLALSEQHILAPQVKKLFLVTMELTEQNDPIEDDFTAVATFGHGVGGRVTVPGDALVLYPVIMELRKYPTTGKAGKLFYEGMLYESEVNRQPDGQVFLRGGYDVGSLMWNYFNSFIDEAPMMQILVSFDRFTRQPIGWREITSYGGFEAKLLTSIPQAQRRKTFKARPYQAAAQALAQVLADFGIMFFQAAHFSGERVSPEKMADVKDALARLLSGIVGIQEYYTEGIKEDYADCWRPTSGLDPDTRRAEQILSKLEKQVTALRKSILDLPPDEDGTFAASDFAGLEPQNGIIAGRYVRFMELERFTGTPKYIPALLSMCRAGNA